MNLKNIIYDGRVLVSANYTFDEEILKLMRYWIPHVTVIFPVRLQKQLKRGVFGLITIHHAALKSNSGMMKL